MIKALNHIAIFFPNPMVLNQKIHFISAFRTFSDNDLANKEDLQSTALMVFEFLFLLL